MNYWTDEEEELIIKIKNEEDKIQKDKLLLKIYPKIKQLVEGTITGQVQLNNNDQRLVINDSITQVILGIDKFYPEKNKTAYSYLSAIAKFSAISFLRKKNAKYKKVVEELTEHHNTSVQVDEDGSITSPSIEEVINGFELSYSKIFQNEKPLKKQKFNKIKDDVIEYLQHNEVYSVEELLQFLLNKKNQRHNIKIFLFEIGIKIPVYFRKGLNNKRKEKEIL